MKPLIIIMTMLLSASAVYSVPFINEINFVDEEFIEIKSDEILNLSGKKVYDETGPEKFNTLTQIKQTDSDYYLIIGKSFEQKFDLDQLNCNIYLTDKSQVSNGGLKSSAEDILIETSEGNLSWIKQENLQFDTNQTLNYNVSSNTYFVALKSPCTEPTNESEEEIVINSTPEENQTNTTKECTDKQPNQNESESENPSEIEETPQENTCNYSFEIKSELVFEDKIQFRFETNATNYTISYWVEDFNEQIVKEKRNTTNSNIKSFTPEDRTEVYTLRAKLLLGNCSYEASKDVFFYTETVAEEPQTSDPNSYLEILNSTNNESLVFEIYRGDVSESEVDLIHNDERIATLTLEKYSKIKGEIPIEAAENTHFKIEGFSLSTVFNLTKIENQTQPTDNGNITNQSNETQTNETMPPVDLPDYFEIANLTQINRSLVFNIGSNIDNLDANCYAVDVRRKISSVANVSENKTNLSLLIRDKRIFFKAVNNTVQIKLTCKYKKKELKTFKYEHEYINFTLWETPRTSGRSQPEYIVETKTKVFTNYSNSDNLTNKTRIKTVVDVYNSKNEKVKGNAQNSVMVAMAALLSLLVSRW